MSPIPFIKMHGLGNDFVIIDARYDLQLHSLNTYQITFISDRYRGIGCDQVILLTPAINKDCIVYMHIYNANGQEVSVCGNAIRCVAYLIIQKENIRTPIMIETMARIFSAKIDKNGLTTVDMGIPSLKWNDIPLSYPVNTLHLNIEIDALCDPVSVNIGNPHMIFFVKDIQNINLEIIGPILEKHKLFPEHTNVEIVQILNSKLLRMRVWERGVGITQACGTGACAALVAAVKRGLSLRNSEIILDGGSLFIEWRDDDHVLMSGLSTMVFTGYINNDLLI